jgi:hypothetical protein
LLGENLTKKMVLLFPLCGNFILVLIIFHLALPALLAERAL